MNLREAVSKKREKLSLMGGKKTRIQSDARKKKGKRVKLCWGERRFGLCPLYLGFFAEHVNKRTTCRQAGGRISYKMGCLLPERGTCREQKSGSVVEPGW